MMNAAPNWDQQIHFNDKFCAFDVFFKTSVNLFKKRQLTAISICLFFSLSHSMSLTDWKRALVNIRTQHWGKWLCYDYTTTSFSELNTIRTMFEHWWRQMEVVSKVAKSRRSYQQKQPVSTTCVTASCWEEAIISMSTRVSYFHTDRNLILKEVWIQWKVRILLNWFFFCNGNNFDWKYKQIQKRKTFVILCIVTLKQCCERCLFPLVLRVIWQNC